MSQVISPVLKCQSLLQQNWTKLRLEIIKLQHRFPTLTFTTQCKTWTTTCAQDRWILKLFHTSLFQATTCSKSMRSNSSNHKRIFLILSAKKTSIRPHSFQVPWGLRILKIIFRSTWKPQPKEVHHFKCVRASMRSRAQRVTISPNWHQRASSKPNTTPWSTRKWPKRDN